MFHVKLLYRKAIINMNIKYKFLTFTSISLSSILGIHIINKIIKSNAIAKNLLNKSNSLYYSWKFGNIRYIKKGHKSPILLIHDLSTVSSLREWDNIINTLSKKHTVYALDLLGCGKSDKPDIIYNNFLLAQLINDFIKNVICKPTSVIATGSSCPIITTSCKIDNELFDKIFFISPDNPNLYNSPVKKRNKLYSLLLNTYILGDLLYNISFSKKQIQKKLLPKYFYKSSPAKQYLNLFYETSHSEDLPKKLYSSILNNFTKFNIIPAISSMDNTIIIFYGNEDINYIEAADTYNTINPSIELIPINSSKRFPHIENSVDFLNQLDIFL